MSNYSSTKINYVEVYEIPFSSCISFFFFFFFCAQFFLFYFIRLFLLFVVAVVAAPHYAHAPLALKQCMWWRTASTLTMMRMSSEMTMLWQQPCDNRNNNKQQQKQKRKNELRMTRTTAAVATVATVAATVKKRNDCVHKPFLRKAMARDFSLLFNVHIFVGVNVVTVVRVACQLRRRSQRLAHTKSRRRRRNKKYTWNRKK